MKILHVLSIAVLSLALFSCRENYVDGRGATRTEDRSLSKTFSSIEIDAPVDAVITVQAAAGNSISLSGYANVLKYITTEIRDNTLHISIPASVALHTDRKINARISCASLDDISISGDGEAQVSNGFSTQKFSVSISGAASVALQDIRAAKLRVDVSGAGTFSAASGKVEDAKYDLSGAAKVKAFGLECERIDFDLSGTGKAEIFATAKLDASVSGVGNILYRGDPKVSADVSGVGNISREDGRPAQYSQLQDSKEEDDNDDDSGKDGW